MKSLPPMPQHEIPVTQSSKDTDHHSHAWCKEYDQVYTCMGIYRCCILTVTIPLTFHSPAPGRGMCAAYINPK